MTTGCCIKGVRATIKTTSKPCCAKNFAVNAQYSVSVTPGKIVVIHGNPWYSTAAERSTAPTVDPAATQSARRSQRRGVNIELEIRIPSFGIIMIKLSRAAKRPRKGGYQRRFANR